MPHITRGAAALATGPLIPVLPNDVLRHLGGVLRDTCAPGDAGRFAALLSRLDAALASQADADRAVDAAFRADLLRLMPNLHRYAVSLTRDAVAAEDVVQEAMMRAWRGRGGFVRGTNIEAWLFTITRNAFFTSARTRGRELSDVDGEEAARLAVIPDQDGRADLADARAALARLPANMREALMLIAVEGVSYEDAATILSCRIGTVKSRVWRARQGLAQALGYHGSEVGSDGLMLSASSGVRTRSLPP